MERNLSWPRSYESIRWPHPTHAPFSITKYIAKECAKYYDVKLYDWHDARVCKTKPGDIFLFHPVPDTSPDPSDERTWKKPLKKTIGWQTLQTHENLLAVPIIPYTCDTDTGWLHEILMRCQGKIFIVGGKIWEQHWLHQSSYHAEAPHPVRLDMGIDLNEYPFVRRSFNPIGSRKILYVGHTARYKNPVQLEAIAAAMPDVSFSHVGFGTLRGWNKLGQDIRFTAKSYSMINNHDLFLSVSNADAQATTILEQMAFGTPVLATPESGYSYACLAKLKTDDTDYNVEVIRQLLSETSDRLFELAHAQRLLAQHHHSWERFSDLIISNSNAWKQKETKCKE